LRFIYNRLASVKILGLQNDASPPGVHQSKEVVATSPFLIPLKKCFSLHELLVDIKRMVALRTIGPQHGGKPRDLAELQ
jgi:hypothetical protein